MAGVIALILLPIIPETAGLLIFVTCFGLSLGVRSPIIATLSAQLFRGRGMASIYGCILTGQGFGAAAGSWLAGILHDSTGGYGGVFALSLLAICVGILLFWVIPEMQTNKGN